MRSHSAVRTVCVAIFAALVSGLGSAAHAEAIKVAWVYNSPIGDAGWTFQHDQGRLTVERAFGDRVKTSFVESATEADAERIINGFAASGHKVIFATSFGFMNPMIRVAKRHPRVVFQHATGYKLAKNVGVYHARAYEARYLAGVLAGKMSKAGVAGFVASFPIPEVVRGINAFTLGMRSVNPNAQVKVVWISSWYDPGKEREATEALIAEGADVINQFTDSTAPVQTAEAKGIYAIAVGSDMSKYGPRAHLTSVVYQWGGYYSDVVKKAMTGSWKSESVWGGLKKGMIDIAPINAAVPQDVRNLVLARRTEIIAGDLHPFQGPVKDQSGKIRVAEGTVMSDGDLLGTDWYVEGVQGKLPN